jgi:acyl dehydratase
VPEAAGGFERRFPIGRRAEIRHVFTLDQVRQFAAVTGDHNPLHVDPARAARGRFGRPVVHGMFTAALFSRLLATELPGPGAIYLAQRLTFRRPVYLDEPVTVSVTVTRRSPRRRVLWLATRCEDAAGRLQVEGEAQVLFEWPEGAPAPV